MLLVKGVAKTFELKNAKQMQSLKSHDPRIRGRRFHVLDEINLSCQSGQVVGLLGANGAGKTSLLRILSSALKADRGDISCNGIRVADNLIQYRKNIGFLSATTGLYERLTGAENLAYFAALYGMNPQQQKQKIAELCEQLDLNTFIQRRFGDYSTGMKQRLSIARSLLHDPKFLILDEPTTGLDIRARSVILEFIESQRKAGKGILFSTHDMAEVSQLCQHLYILNRGQQVFSGSPETLLENSQSDHLTGAILERIGT